ncbi:hypothetical protein Taro_032271, partial [Colocasia esculenta]|nr:hypothetical protein [Colocasia esculenta]
MLPVRRCPVDSKNILRLQPPHALPLCDLPRSILHEANHREGAVFGDSIAIGGLPVAGSQDGRMPGVGPDRVPCGRIPLRRQGDPMNGAPGAEH